MDWILSSINWLGGSLDRTIAIYAVFLAAIVGASVLVLGRWRKNLFVYLAVWGVYPLACLWLAFMLGRDIFDAINLTAMAVFVGGTSLLAASAFLAWPLYKRFAGFLGVLAVVLGSVGLDAFVIEPQWLEVRYEKIHSPKLARKLRLVVVTDLQTDHIGGYEEGVLARVMKEKPDIVLFPGDYIQAHGAQHGEEIENLRACLRKLDFKAPSGIFAVGGDAERSDWTGIFEGLPVTTFGTSGTVKKGDIAVTGLTLGDSWSLKYDIPKTDCFHIVVGHRPDFATSVKEGDLVVAGHTHGGQVRLPFWGPVLTFSRAPREWCGGCNIELAPGRSFIISRGVGMERGYAPRLRFLCRPEIVVIDAEPGL